MKKVLSLVLSVMMLFSCFAASTTSYAASKNMGTVNFSLKYGSVWLYDQREASQNTLEAMAELGLITKSVHSGVYDYDLDKDGKFDMWFVYEESEEKFENYERNDETNIVGQWEYKVPQSVKDKLIAAGKDYCSQYLIEFDDSCPKGGLHDWKDYIQKATFGKDGCTYKQCSKCKEKEVGWPLMEVDAKLETTSYTYDGKAKTPKVLISTCDGPLGQEYYKVEYINNVAVGTASVKVTLLGDYFGGTKTLNFKITGKMPKNTMTAKGKKVPLKAKKIKNKKVVIKRKKAIVVNKAKGAVSYKKAKGNKAITVNKKNGNITVKKGLKKGTYKVKIKVTAAGNDNFAAKTQTVTVTVIVK